MSEYVEDVWAIVRERNGLRAKVKRLEAENARLHAIIASYGDKVSLKSADAAEQKPHRHRQSTHA